MDNKWLFSDFDGTLRNGKDGKVDSKDLTFVKDFMKNDNQFIIASGRPYNMMVHEMDLIGVKPDMYVVNAGALIYSGDGKLLHKTTIDRKYNKILVDYLESMDLKSLIFATPENEYYLYSDNPSRFENGELKRPILNKPYSYLLDVDLVCFKVIDTRDKLDKLIEFVKTNCPELTVINNNDSNLVEIHAPNSSKGTAIKIVQSMYDLKDDQIIVAGDDDNDITMLDWFKNSFVIKQPYNEDVQRHGTYKIDHLYEINNFINKENA